jgi:aspartate racemase
MNKKLPMLGVLGGMGTVVTAEFLKSIYEYNQFIDKEQEFYATASEKYP